MSPAAVYRDGVLHSPGPELLAKCGKAYRPLPKDDKVFVREIKVDVNEDRLGLFVIECGDCNGMDPMSGYKTVVGFQFAKGYLKKASVPDVEDTIAQVFDVYTPPVTPPGPKPLASGPATPSQELTNSDILELVAVKLPDSVILAKIQSSVCTFDMSTDELVRLKQAGVSDTILQAMVSIGSQPAEAPLPAAEPEVPAPSAETTSTPAISVEGTVEAFLMAANQGSYSEAETYCSSSMKNLMAKHGGLKELSEKETKNGTVERIEFLSQKLGLRGFNVRFKIYYKDGTSKDDSARVVMEGGSWKIKN